MEGHAPDCACCVVRVNKRQRGEDADLSNFLPPADDAPLEEEEGEEEGEEEEADAHSLDRLISNALFAKFEQHVSAIEQARAARQELLTFKSALEDEGDVARVSADASLDERDALGVRMPGDLFQGDVNMRTLQKLLTRVDQRGFERSSQQLEFHEAFLKAAARIIFKGDWETEKPAIMRKYGWETSNSEVLISTPRRFGKTFSIAIFCACLALAFGLEIVVFSPARRASRKLLERIVEFIKLSGGEKRICEYNQEACRLNAFDGRKSLIRSFPSKVGVRAVAILEPA